MKLIEEIINKDIQRKFKAPEKTSVPHGFKSIFLAGSIEMNKAEKWQDAITKDLLKEFNKLIIFNPRRENWNSSWTQEISNKNFYGQVDWEHEHIVKADYLLIYFQKDTQSPISLLELGLAAGLKKNTVVCCPDGFWRKGNVDYICKEYGMKTIDSLDHLVPWLKRQGVE